MKEGLSFFSQNAFSFDDLISNLCGYFKIIIEDNTYLASQFYKSKNLSLLDSVSDIEIIFYSPCKATRNLDDAKLISFRSAKEEVIIFILEGGFHAAIVFHRIKKPSFYILLFNKLSLGWSSLIMYIPGSHHDRNQRSSTTKTKGSIFDYLTTFFK